MLAKLTVVEEKISKCASLVTLVTERGKTVGREGVILPQLQEILNHLMVCFDKLNNEASRIVSGYANITSNRGPSRSGCLYLSPSRSRASRLSWE